MVKLFPLMLLLFVVGCATVEPIATKTIETKVPILYCPAPPAIERPVLSIHLMTKDQKMSDGELAKHWKATAIELMGYSKELEIGLGTYFNINMSYDELKRKMESVEQ